MNTTACECGCGKQAKPGRRFLVGHSGGGFTSESVKGNQYARKVPKGQKPPSHQFENKKRYMKQYRQKVPKEKQRASARKSRLWACFRLRPEEQEAIEKYQRQHPIYSKLMGNKLGTDHCHKTGLIRGMLDWRINRAYGVIEKVANGDTAEVLRALAYFHENPPAEIVLGEKRFGLIGKAQYKKKMVYGSPELYEQVMKERNASKEKSTKEEESPTETSSS